MSSHFFLEALPRFLIEGGEKQKGNQQFKPLQQNYLSLKLSKPPLHKPMYNYTQNLPLVVLLITFMKLNIALLPFHPNGLHSEFQVVIRKGKKCEALLWNPRALKIIIIIFLTQAVSRGPVRVIKK